MVLKRSIEDLDKEGIEEEKALIDKLYTDIIGGDDMYAMIKGYGDDEALMQSEGILLINSSYENVLPELYEWSKDAEINDVDIIETAAALFIVKCVDVIDYEKLKDTEDLKEWTKFYIVNKNIEELMASDKYKIKTKEKNYNNLDISDLTKETLDYFSRVWEQ